MLSPYRAVRFGQPFGLLLRLPCPSLVASLRELHRNGTVESACSSSGSKCRSVSVESLPPLVESCLGGAHLALVPSFAFLLSLPVAAHSQLRSARKKKTRSAQPSSAFGLVTIRKSPAEFSVCYSLPPTNGARLQIRSQSPAPQPTSLCSRRLVSGRA